MERKIQYDNGYYYGNVDDNGKRSGIGTYYWKNNEKFDGLWINDKAISGKYHFKNGDIYDGSVYDNGSNISITGRGTIYYNNKDKYVGDVVKCSCEGKGTMYYNDGIIIKGNWKDNNFVGNCKMIDPTGGYCEGFFTHKQNVVILKGKIVTVSGNYYEGTFHNAKLEGKGYFCTSSGKVIYSGEFKNGKYHGFGKLYSTKDTYYEGEFVEGQRHGHGIQHYGPNYYEGEYKNNVACGKGVHVNQIENKIYKGTYKDGVFIPSDASKKINEKRIVYKQTYKNGDYYIGDLVNNIRHGYGTYHQKTYIGEVTYAGKFVNDKCLGYGIKTSGDTKYTGELKGFYRHGEGMQEYNNGKSYVIATFKRDEINGYASFYKYIADVLIAEGMYKHDKFKGKVYLEFENGQKYIGKVKDWTPHGKGVYYFSKSHYVVGKFKNKLAHGKAELFKDGSYYAAVYKKGELISKTLIHKKEN